MKRSIAVFIGTRPEAIKMAPVIHALGRSSHLQPVVVSTGQHREMLQQVVDLFEIPVSHELAVMKPNQTLAGLTSRLIASIDDLLSELRPDMALVQGDTTTVLAAALSCFYRNVPLGHVEAGLRTGNLMAPFPEEANRRLASILVSLHFAPTELSRNHLLREGVAATTIEVTGNTVIDALQFEVSRQSHADLAATIHGELARLLGADWDRHPFVLITGHRRENFGGGFQEICRAIAELAAKYPAMRFIYPVHLNPNVQGPVRDALGRLANVTLTEPLSYRPFVALLRACQLVLTDSGGVQEEAPGLGKPVLVMRDTTERPEGVDAGTVRLVGADAQQIVAGVSELLDDESAYKRMSRATNPYGDGQAAPRIVRRIETYFA